MREHRRWMCGRMGKLVSAEYKLSFDFDFIKET